MRAPTAIAMPKLGMTMREGTVVEWRAAVGDRVEKGVVFLLIESEKTAVEIEAPVSGTLRHIYVEEGDTVACGTLLAAITESADEPFDAEAFCASRTGCADRRSDRGPARCGPGAVGERQCRCRCRAARGTRHTRGPAARARA